MWRGNGYGNREAVVSRRRWAHSRRNGLQSAGRWRIHLNPATLWLAANDTRGGGRFCASGVLSIPLFRGIAQNTHGHHSAASVRSCLATSKTLVFFLSSKIYFRGVKERRRAGTWVLFPRQS